MRALFVSVCLVCGLGSPAWALESSVTPRVVHERTAAELVKMRDAGLQKEVLLAYARNATVYSKVSAQDVLYLHEHKVPEEVICEWINRSGSVQDRTPVVQAPARSPDLVAAYSQPAQPVVSQAPVVVTQASPVVVSSPPVYTYPSYVYSGYSYVPPLYVGFSYGWGRPYWSSWGYYRPHYYGGPWRGGWGGHSYFTGHSHWGGARFAGYRGGFGGHFRGGGFSGHSGGGHRR